MWNNFQNPKEVWIFVNGDIYVCNRKASIFEILRFLTPKQNELIVEYNHKIILPEEYKTISFKQFDKIEVITIVGGG